MRTDSRLLRIVIGGVAAVAVTSSDGRGQRTAASMPCAPVALSALSTVPVPEPSTLSQFVKDKRMAIALGKALFWDMQVGSDGLQACASCHFNAGADSRNKNQVSPGLLRVRADMHPDPDSTFTAGGPNHELTVADFPFRRLADAHDRGSAVVADTDDVSSSQGVFHQYFSSIVKHQAAEVGTPVVDDVFLIGGVNVRRVEPRNTPTVINAVFNHRQFWDGRAQSDFNGVNPHGRRDPGAMVVRTPPVTKNKEQKTQGKELEQVRISLDNASLASQAVEPPLSDREMAFRDRSFRTLGKKLLRLQPLGSQMVHPDDSVLGPLSAAPKPGLAMGYEALVRGAFHAEWWDAKYVVKIMTKRTLGSPDADTDSEQEDDELVRDANGALVLRAIEPRAGEPKSVNEFSLMEYNFALFFGLAVQLYEATLVADDTPVDQFLEGNCGALTSEEEQGLHLFLDGNRIRCVNCHGGPELTHASVRNASANRLFRRTPNILDNGFFNIGVRPTLEDLGIGANDPFGTPLSEARLAKQNRFYDPNLLPPLSAGDILGVDGAFKAPGLRNVELTAPYFHNGGTLTLEQVIDFYARGGDIAPIVSPDGTTIRGLNVLNVPPPSGISAAEKTALVAFLKALTDERVRFRRAPFDHPEIHVPNGHPGSTTSVTPDATGKALDSLLTIPAVGRNGGTPLPKFLQ